VARPKVGGSLVRGPSGVSPEALLLPLGAGFLYSCAAIALKRALGAGISGGWVNLLSNVSMALLFQIFWLFPEATHGAEIPLSLFLAPIACGSLFFLGQACTFRAISAGDVSVATPLLGTKVLIVALLSFLLLGKALPVSWWFGSLLATLGIGLISYAPGNSAQNHGLTIIWSMLAAGVFALTDVLVQHWVPRFGFARFAPLMFAVPGILSIVYVPRLLREGIFLPTVGGRIAFQWLAAGVLLLALQCLGMYTSIGHFGSATVTNILYGSRCLWSVILVWLLGSIGGTPPALGVHRAVMIRRMIGAVLLFAAMALVLS